jgi:AhpC/TSA family
MMNDFPGGPTDGRQAHKASVDIPACFRPASRHASIRRHEPATERTTRQSRQDSRPALSRNQRSCLCVLIFVDKAIDFELPDHDGKPWRLADELKRGPVLLVFYRGDW